MTANSTGDPWTVGGTNAEKTSRGMSDAITTLIGKHAER
jgi:hypothetical protein